MLITICSFSALSFIRASAHCEIHPHLCPPKYMFMYACTAMIWGGVDATQQCILSSNYPSIHPSMPAAILSSFKSTVNLCSAFMLTSKMDTHMQMYITFWSTHTLSLCLTLSPLPLMSCYPACSTLAQRGLSPARQPITGQWGGPRPRQPA